MRVNKTVSAVLATTFAGAVALGGITAGAAFAADQPQQYAGQQVPLPEAQKLQQQARMLAETADALEPVAELIEAVLNAPEGRLSEAEADRHAQAVQEALAPLVEQGRQQTRQESQEQADRHNATRLTADAARALEAQVDQLLRAAEAGDRPAIAKEAQATVQAAVNLVAAASADGRLPAADMKGLPQPTNVQQDMQTPRADRMPQLPENQLPPGNPELELLPY